MKIYNTSQFEKLKINPINLNDFDNLDLIDTNAFQIIKNAVKDADGNYYDAIEINGKIWMASNLRTTKFNDGSKITRFEDSRNAELSYYEYPNVPESLIKDYGLYYNFKAIETEKLAPKGWHIPTIDEFEDLFTYIACNDKFNYTPNVTKPFYAHIAKAICSQKGWKSDNTYINAVGYNIELNNTTKFNVFPSGLWNYTINSSTFLYTYACLWSCTFANMEKIWTVCLENSNSYIRKGEADKYFGYSIRCVKDN